MGGLSVDEYRKRAEQAHTARFGTRLMHATAPSIMELMTKTQDAEDQIEQLDADLIWTPQGERAEVWVVRTFNKEGQPC